MGLAVPTKTTLRDPDVGPGVPPGLRYLQGEHRFGGHERPSPNGLPLLPAHGLQNHQAGPGCEGPRIRRRPSLARRAWHPTLPERWGPRPSRARRAGGGVDVQGRLGAAQPPGRIYELPHVPQGGDSCSGTFHQSAQLCRDRGLSTSDPDGEHGVF